MRFETDISQPSVNNIGYSQIISAEEYNHQVSNEHLYMAQADSFLEQLIIDHCQNRDSSNIVELGSGPGRILPLIRNAAPNADITAVEIDPVFISYCDAFAKKNNITLVQSDVENYRHNTPVDIFISHGLHHHVTKGLKTDTYLNNIKNSLKNDGRYFLVDEFLPNYANDKEREIRTIIWHSHIIAHAARKGFSNLAIEEAKILLDDVQEGRGVQWFKNIDQVKFVLESVQSIDEAARSKNSAEALPIVEQFLEKLETMINHIPTGDRTLDLSRHDFKISLEQLKSELNNACLVIEAIKAFGKIDTIGGVVVCVLKASKA